LEIQAISRSEFEERQERARRAVTARGWDALLVIGRSFYDRPGNVAYYANHFPPFPATVSSGDLRGMGHAALLLPVTGAPVLLIDGRSYRDDLVAVNEVHADANLPRGLAAILQDQALSTATIGLAGEDILPVGLFRELAALVPGVTWRPADALVNQQRMIKSPAEIALLRQAAQVAEAGLSAALDQVVVGATEAEVCATGTAAALRAGADFVRYLRVHSGPWSAWGSRWPQATDRRLARGDLVTLDIIGAAQGYQFDVLRTTVVGYDTLPEQQAVCTAVFKALAKAIQVARPGNTAGDVARAAHEVLDQAGYAEHASGFVGHGIGLETVEEPMLVPADATPLAAGMVLCVEPAIYIRGWGGCSIEEEIVVTEGEPELLTTLSRRLWE
jgi:Xaa-Pro dipeptidase